MRIEDFFDDISAILASGSQRTLIGIVGKPGAGKSTVVDAVTKKFPIPEVAIIPMDGYHLSNEVLIDMGARDRKGAPDTFDSLGFIELLNQVKRKPNEEIRFPIFHREIEASVENEGAISPSARVIITEGNYLFSTDHNWDGVFPLLDQTYYIEISDEIRLARLIARHHAYGKTIKDAESWARGSDEANARFIERTSGRAEKVIHLS